MSKNLSFRDFVIVKKEQNQCLACYRYKLYGPFGVFIGDVRGELDEDVCPYSDYPYQIGSRYVTKGIFDWCVMLIKAHPQCLVAIAKRQADAGLFWAAQEKIEKELFGCE